jgi:hypothetical protein
MTRPLIWYERPQPDKIKVKAAIRLICGDLCILMTARYCAKTQFLMLKSLVGNLAGREGGP